jgi:hypothetical protein
VEKRMQAIEESAGHVQDAIEDRMHASRLVITNASADRELRYSSFSPPHHHHID